MRKIEIEMLMMIFFRTSFEPKHFLLKQD